MMEIKCYKSTLIALQFSFITWGPGLGSSTWSQVQVQLLCQVASTSTSTDLKSQVQVQVL